MAGIEEVHKELGELFIEEQALARIVYGALLEVEGLYTPDRVRGKGLLDSISRVQQGDGIQIDTMPVGGEEGEEGPEEGAAEEPERRLRIKLSLVGQYGMPIHQAAERAIRTVSRRLRELAGAEVGHINVEIIGITEGL